MQNRRQLMIAAGAAAALAATRASAQPSGAEAQLSAYLDQVFKEALDDSPELVTSLGLDKGERAAAKAQMHDFSLAGVAKRQARTSSAA